MNIHLIALLSCQVGVANSSIGVQSDKYASLNILR